MSKDELLNKKDKILDIIEREELVLNSKSASRLISKFTMLDVIQEIKDILEASDAKK